MLRSRVALAILAPILSSACAHTAPRLTPQRVALTISVRLHDHDLKLHLSAPRSDRAPVLLVYTTGDRGWWGKDRDMYTHVADWDYATVGFSAREYLHHLGKDAMLPREVADDYAVIIRAATSALHLPLTARAVLVGKSRGAGLAIAAAGSELLRSHLAGVLAVGLTREEEFVHHRLRRARENQRVMLQTYSYLPRLGGVPVAVIQSTHDEYLPAAEARQLFGRDTPVRELIPIEARDHNFGGALDVLYDQMARSVDWIVQR